ncbi:MAG TPA: GNAT family N-acetyltransferase [bacterium]|nr:GNAT family N-acetyltransferase [bacterium]HPN35693.1 GNAT family N-acetyltransferase [bacterium]
MVDDNTFSARLRRAKQRAREDGFLMVLLLLLRQAMNWIGIKVNLFYWMNERMPKDPPASMQRLADGYAFSIFGPNEIAAIIHHPERIGFKESYVLEKYKSGDTCLGCKFNGEIAGFTWYSLTECKEWYYQAVMEENEAYLSDIFVFKAFRGKKLSLILRYKSYEALRELGRDSYYSITDYTNKASYQFKKRLDARIVFLGLHVEFFGKWQKRWIVKKY